MNQNKWFIIEGNIGCGKSTLIQKLGENELNEVIPEPVDMWLNIKGNDGKNLLQEFYDNPTRYSYLFQSIVFKTRLQVLDKPQEKTFRFSERSLWTDRYVFGKACMESNLMNELEKNSYLSWFDWLENKFYSGTHCRKPDGIIYLQCSPNKCLERMMNRARNEEVGVSLDYLTTLHENHENWFKNWDKTPLLVIDNNQDNNWNDMLNKINNFITNI
jgi:deoxyadenosine/deoxycytidine kinase